MADIVLKDRNGNDIQYPGIERIKLNTTDGETAEFVSPDLVPELLEDIPIALDFSGGDQLISAPEGMAVKTATLLKPETLVPENIVEGVDIAGIIGSFASGGGGGVVASGTVSNLGTTVLSTLTATHGLGVVPDLIFVCTTSAYKPQYLMYAIGLSAALKNSVTFKGNLGIWVSSADSSNTNSYGRTNTGMESVTEGPFIHNVTTNEFTFGSSTKQIAPYATYHWIAIAGLS